MDEKPPIIESHNVQQERKLRAKRRARSALTWPLLAIVVIAGTWLYVKAYSSIMSNTIKQVAKTAETITNVIRKNSPNSSSSSDEPGSSSSSSTSKSATPVRTPDLAIAHPLRVGSFKNLGTIGAPVSVKNRDGGTSIKLGNQILWAFGDTLFNPKSTDGTNLRTNTAALANPTNPLATTEPTDSNGAPKQFIPFTSEELAYNKSKNNASDRFALWPNGFIPTSDTQAALYFVKIKVKPGYLNYEFLGSGIARVSAGSTTAKRNSNLVFNETATEKVYGRASFKEGDIVYSYACSPKTTNCTVAKVDVSSIENRSSYLFWNGSSWVSDINSAKTVLSGPSAGFSVSWNDHLQRYIAVYIPAFSGKAVLQTASSPIGPWSKPTTLFNTPKPAEGVTYAGYEHPELSSDGGKKLFITYYLPGKNLAGTLQATQVNLN